MVITMNYKLSLHMVSFTKGLMLENLLGREFSVNSFHGVRVVKPAEDLEVTCVLPHA